MSKNILQKGFVPFIIALLAALSLGGGMVAYKVQKNKQEIKSQKEEQNKKDVLLQESQKSKNEIIEDNNSGVSNIQNNNAGTNVTDTPILKTNKVNSSKNEIENEDDEEYDDN